MKYILIIIMFLLMISITYAANVDKKVLDELNANDEVSVIVYYKDDFNVNNIKTLNDVKIKYNYNTLNGFSGRINKKNLEKLKNDDAVKSIYFDDVLYINLQDSLPLINATTVHNKLINNLNLTGKGQTICILDTGINYSHSDLGGCFRDGCRVIDGYDFVNNNSDPYDDHGHGTHVAGIAAASGGIIGVAPEANITMVKVCNSLGECGYSNIAAGLDWCNNHKDTYNIHVISMSLGTPAVYSEYCDNDFLTSVINTAVGNNITVTVSSGNQGSTTQISAPACIKNATAVGAVDKNDNLQFNRNKLVDVVAPGDEINSTYHNTTYFSNLYAQLSGTSMAAPHVAGMVALLQQYKQEESNRVLDKDEIDAALKSSDKIITDVTGLNYTRININKALISIDDKSPTFTISINPISLYLTSNNVSINFSAIDTNLDKVLVNVSYPNGSLMTQSSSNFILNKDKLNVIGDYNITIFANDSNGNVNLSYYTLQVNDADNAPSVTLNSPLNNFNLSNKLVNFECLSQDDHNLKNISLYINSTGNFILNQTKLISGINNITNFNLTLDDGDYLWNCLVYDNLSNGAFAQNNFTFKIDTLPPMINSILHGSITENSVIISWNTNEIANSSVYYGTTKETSNIKDENNFALSHSLQLSGLSANTIYYYNVSSCDLVNNCNTSIQYNFTTSQSPSNNGGSDGGGGSGGGGGSSGGSPGGTTTVNVLDNNKTNNETTIFIPNTPEDNEEGSETSSSNNEITGQTVSNPQNIVSMIRENKWQSISALIVLILLLGFIYFKYIKKKN